MLVCQVILRILGCDAAVMGQKFKQTPAARDYLINASGREPLHILQVASITFVMVARDLRLNR